MDTNNVKIDVRSKQILSPTRSLDEGFESDPDRISTDSELQTQTPQFDILQRTDRDGVTHTQITRRALNSDYISGASKTPTTSTTALKESSTSSVGSAQISLICVPGEVDSEIEITTNANNLQPPQRPERYRRNKTKAPAPPTSTHPRSHSVDAIRHMSSNSQTSNDSDLVIRGKDSEMDTQIINGDVLSGKFVRVQVDPRNQIFQSNQHLHSQNNRLLRSNSSSMYALYNNNNNSGNSNNHSSPSSNNSSNLQLWPSSLSTGNTSSSPSMTSSSSKTGGSSLSRHLYHQYPVKQSSSSSNSRYNIHRISHPVPVCWTQSIPRQTRRWVFTLWQNILIECQVI